jgi:hypothetical protein
MGPSNSKPLTRRARRPQPTFEALVRVAAGDLHRLFVVSPSMAVPACSRSSPSGRLPVHAALAGWEDDVDRRCSSTAGVRRLRGGGGQPGVVRVRLRPHLRVGGRRLRRRIGPAKGGDHDRMRRFPDVNVGIGVSPRGRGLPGRPRPLLQSFAHFAGSDLDINLFPHRRELTGPRLPRARSSDAPDDTSRGERRGSTPTGRATKTRPGFSPI